MASIKFPDVLALYPSLLEPKYFAICAILVFLLYITYGRCIPHNSSPTVGVPPGILGPLIAPYRWKKESKRLIHEGMLKYGSFGKPFKIGSPARWMTFITNPTILNEMKSMPLHIVSYRHAANEFLSVDYTLHEGIMTDAWHIVPIRNNLTKRLTMLLPEIADEVAKAWAEKISLVNQDDWSEINPYPALVDIVARSTNRVLVGLPLCRNKKYLDSVSQFSIQALKASAWLDMAPWFLQASVAGFLLSRDKTFAGVLEHIGPIFEERRRQINNDDSDTPNDVFKWILQAAPPDTPPRKLAGAFMLYQMAAIDTTSMTISHAIFDLAANPSYQAPLRCEIDEQLAEAGWTKQASEKMKKTDSVLRESARMNGVMVGTVIRKVITPHTFSDGTYVTKNSWVVAPATSIHRSSKIYDSPDTFGGLRFYNMRKAEGMGAKFQSTSTSVDYLVFGHGLSACPGRFFATGMLKILLAQILCNYEFKLKGGTTRPVNWYGGIWCFPDTSVSLLFRPRKVSKGSGLFSDDA